MKVMLDNGAIKPVKAHREDAGFDLFAMKDFTIRGGENAIVDTGVHVEIPMGHCGLILNKSGLSCKNNIESSVGVIDCGYTGSIWVKLKNLGWESYDFHKGEKISQLVIVRIPFIEEMELVESLEETERGDKGFGSSGR